MCLILKAKTPKKKQPEGHRPGVTLPGWRNSRGVPRASVSSPHPALNPRSRSSPSILRSSTQTPQAPSLHPTQPWGTPRPITRPPPFPPARASSQEENSCLGLSVLAAGADSVGAPLSLLTFPVPRAPAPTLFFLLKGQRLARLRPGPRSSGRPSEGVPRLLSEGTRFMGWLKSSNSTSPGRAKPDLCSSIRTWESCGGRWGGRGAVRGKMRCSAFGVLLLPTCQPPRPGPDTHILGVYGIRSHLHAL